MRSSRRHAPSSSLVKKLGLSITLEGSKSLDIRRGGEVGPTILDRRQILQGFAAGGLACAAGGPGLLARTDARSALIERPPVVPGRIHDWHFVAKERSARLLGAAGPRFRSGPMTTN